MSLARFFQSMEGMINGAATAAQVESELGTSASGTKRLGLYATLVKRQRHGALSGFFEAVAVAANSQRAGAFLELTNAYLAAHPPTHWYPPEAGRHFSDFLTEQGQPVLAELADFAFTRHSVQISAHGAHAGVGPTLALRHYTHAVAAFSGEVERAERTEGVPEPIPQTWLITRSRHTGKLLLRGPTLATLVSLQVLEQGGWPEVLPAGLTRGVLEEELRALAEAGVLPEGTRGP
jgi:hypothetical protein